MSFDKNIQGIRIKGDISASTVYATMISGTSIFANDNQINLRSWIAAPSYSAIYMGVVPGITNFTLASNGGGTIINSPSGGFINLQIANADKFTLTNTYSSWGIPMYIGSAAGIAPNATNLEIAGSSSSKSSLKISTGTTVTSPNSGDIWNNGTVMHLHSGLEVQGLTGSTGTTRMVEVNSGGTMSAYKEIVSAYLSDPTAISLLTTFSNWNLAGVYTGTTLTNTYQGQFYGDTGDTYVYLALADNYFARIPRV